MISTGCRKLQPFQAKNKYIEGFNFKTDDFWLPLKVEDLTKRSFPPDVMLPNKQSAPEWFHQTDANVQKQMTKLWSRKSKKWVLTGKARQKRLAFVFYKRGKLRFIFKLRIKCCDLIDYYRVY